MRKRIPKDGCFPIYTETDHINAGSTTVAIEWLQGLDPRTVCWYGSSDFGATIVSTAAELITKFEEKETISHYLMVPVYHDDEDSV